MKKRALFRLYVGFLNVWTCFFLQAIWNRLNGIVEIPRNSFLKQHLAALSLDLPAQSLPEQEENAQGRTWNSGGSGDVLLCILQHHKILSAVLLEKRNCIEVRGANSCGTGVFVRGKKVH